MLTDTGPLVALVNRNDPHYTLCLAVLKRLPVKPLVTTWPCFTEAMYLGYRAGSYPAQAALWLLRTSGRLVIHELSDEETARMQALMEKYKDTPMNLVDASLVAAAEGLGLTRIFTIDSDFYVYRLVDGTALEVVR